MDTLQKEMDSGNAKKNLLAKQIQHTTSSIQKLEAEMKEYLNTRNAQNEAFKNGLKADTDAVMLLAKAIEALSKYATNNKLALTQKKANKQVLSLEFRSSWDSQTFFFKGYFILVLPTGSSINVPLNCNKCLYV